MSDSHAGAGGPAGPPVGEGGADAGGLAALEEAVGRLVDLEPTALGDAEAVRRLAVAFARLDCAFTRAVAAFDASGTYRADGALCGGSWLAVEARLPRGEALRRVNLGRNLRHLPVTEAAWAAGEINAAHATRLAGVRREATAAALARDEELLVGKAKTFRYESFSNLVRYWEGHADPDGTEDKAEAQRARRDVYLAHSFDGMYLGRMTLDPISGAIVAGELERLVEAAFKADWEEAKNRLGRDPHVDELARSFAQRRADALVEMATRSAALLPGARRPAPLFSVLVGYETLKGRICELANGVVVSPGSLAPWLDSAEIERVVFGPANRVEVSERARLFTGATRRAIELRDRSCTHPYCYAPASRCQVDHIVPYPQGGPTTQANGRLACPAHNRGRNNHPPEWFPDPEWWSEAGPAESGPGDGASEDPGPPTR